MFVFFFKQKTAYEMRISDWSSDVCSSDLLLARVLQPVAAAGLALAVTAGLLLFAVSATKYATTPVFLVKLALLAAAVVNAVLLRRHPDWVLARVPGLAAEPGPRLKAAAALSLVLWLGVILCGRFLAYLA